LLGVIGEVLNSEGETFSRDNKFVVAVEVRLVVNELVNKIVSVVFVVVAIQFVYVGLVKYDVEQVGQAPAPGQPATQQADVFNFN
jgi:hypothetical protein